MDRFPLGGEHQLEQRLAGREQKGPLVEVDLDSVIGLEDGKARIADDILLVRCCRPPE
jgi:hypothetical protein